MTCFYLRITTEANKREITVILKDAANKQLGLLWMARCLSSWSWFSHKYFCLLLRGIYCVGYLFCRMKMKYGDRIFVLKQMSYCHGIRSSASEVQGTRAFERGLIFQLLWIWTHLRQPVLWCHSKWIALSNVCCFFNNVKFVPRSMSTT
jgi:hypothetical protein